MPISRDEANALAELLAVIRPAWNTRGIIRSGLVPLAHHPAPLEVIVWAAIRAARDPNVRTPAVIPTNASHWYLADRPATPRLTPEHECRTHPGKWADNCPECRVGHYESQLSPGGDPKPNPFTDPDLAHLTPIEQARAIAQRAQRTHAGTHDNDQDDDVRRVDPVGDSREDSTP